MRKRAQWMAVFMVVGLIASCSAAPAEPEVETTESPATTTSEASPQTSTSQVASEESDGVDLRMTIWTSNEDHLALFDSIAEEYLAANPEVGSITYDPLPFNDYGSIVTTQIAGGDPPDLAWIVERSAPDFVGSGALVPLDDILSSTEGYELEDLTEAATALWRSEDGLMAYPFSSSPFVMFVNDDLLAQAGQPSGSELVESDWTWETVSEVGAAVNEATGMAGFVIRDFEYLLWEVLATVWMGWGAQPWDDASCLFASPEMVDAFEFLHEAAFERQSMPGPGTTADFFAGEAAFTVTQISRAALLEEDGFEWDLLPLPAGPAGEYSMIGQAGIGVLAQGPNPEVAADFLAYFTNPENSASLAQFFPPPRRSQTNTETLAAANPVLTEAQLDEVVVPAILNGRVGPQRTNAAQISEAVRAALDSLWVAEADVAGVLTQVCASIEPLMVES